MGLNGECFCLGQTQDLLLRERERELGKEPSLSPLPFPLSTHLYFSTLSLSLSLSLAVYIFMTSHLFPIWVLSLLSSRVFFFLSLLGLGGLLKMMKKGRRVVMMESSPSSSSLPPLGGGGDARARFKHQVLLQDYGELLRETEAKKKKFQKTIEKKLKLMAEVKFLRRKYKSFSMKPSQETPYRLKKLPRKKSSPSVRFAQPQNTINISDLPLQDRNRRAKKASAPSTSALFDLNKVSLPNAEEEMEGIQVDWEPLKLDKSQRCSMDREVAVHDLNLPIFKYVGNGSSHVNKRKFSWQDQVALRV